MPALSLAGPRQADADLGMADWQAQPETSSTFVHQQAQDALGPWNGNSVGEDAALMPLMPSQQPGAAGASITAATEAVEAEELQDRGAQTSLRDVSSPAAAGSKGEAWRPVQCRHCAAAQGVHETGLVATDLDLPPHMRLLPARCSFMQITTPVIVMQKGNSYS